MHPGRLERAALAFPQASTPSAIAQAVDAAFVEDGKGPRQTKAVLIVHDGQLIAERYAEGYSTETPLLSFSLAKSVTNALAGVLVNEGRLRVDAPLALKHARGTATIEDAMRMVTGLDLDEDGSGFDPSNWMTYVHTDDMYAYASRAKAVAPVGERWAYSSASTLLVSHALTEAAGGPQAIQRLARESLFDPAGMGTVIMETDQVGTPIGGHYMMATARSYARLGQLFLRDGIAPDGRRLLPEGWVRWSSTPSLESGYGAGFWLNRRGTKDMLHRYDMPLMPDVPADAFCGLGNLGQWIVVVPSRSLVIVRFGFTMRPYFDIEGMNRLIADTIAATGDGAAFQHRGPSNIANQSAIEHSKP